jgi:hypothetical protein
VRLFRASHIATTLRIYSEGAWFQSRQTPGIHFLGFPQCRCILSVAADIYVWFVHHLIWTALGELCKYPPPPCRTQPRMTTAGLEFRFTSPSLQFGRKPEPKIRPLQPDTISCGVGSVRDMSLGTTHSVSPDIAVFLNQWGASH